MMFDFHNFAQEVRLRYIMLLQTFTGILATALDDANPDSNSTRSSMIVNAGAASSFFLSRLDQDLHTVIETILSAAVTDAEMMASPKLTPEHVAELHANANSVCEEMMIRMRAITNGNVGAIVSELRRVKLTTSLLQSSGVSRFGALMKARMNRVSDIKFVTHDSMGRKLRSAEYVAGMISKELMQLYVESFLYCAALDGDTVARVVYPDPTHINNGLVFLIAGEEGRTFDTIKDVIWHPNSTAGVQRVHS